MKKIFLMITILGFVSLCSGCKSDIPIFDETRAFAYLVRQCDFGPRNPGSDGYYACLEYIKTELDQSADEIILQDFSYQEQRNNNKYE